MKDELGQDEDILDVVSLEDQVIGRATRREVHLQSLVYRSVHIMVFNSKDDLYLQKRVLSKEENPGPWDSSAAGHVESNEDYLTCANRELMEELGIVCVLEEKFRLRACAETSWEHIAVYLCVSDREPIPNPSEIIKGMFMDY
tara:strand:- start:1880 stop:2308 length:429 start_codon:yes stop_codon:yes gene_type:complete